MHQGPYTSSCYKIRDLNEDFYWQTEEREGQEQLMHPLYEQVQMD